MGLHRCSLEFLKTISIFYQFERYFSASAPFVGAKTTCMEKDRLVDSVLLFLFHIFWLWN